MFIAGHRSVTDELLSAHLFHSPGSLTAQQSFQCCSQRQARRSITYRVQKVGRGELFGLLHHPPSEHPRRDCVQCADEELNMNERGGKKKVTGHCGGSSSPDRPVRANIPLEERC